MWAWNPYRWNQPEFFKSLPNEWANQASHFITSKKKSHPTWVDFLGSHCSLFVMILGKAKESDLSCLSPLIAGLKAGRVLRAPVASLRNIQMGCSELGKSIQCRKLMTFLVISSERTLIMKSKKNIIDKIILSRKYLKDKQSIHENMETKRIKGSVKKVEHNNNEKSSSTGDWLAGLYPHDQVKVAQKAGVTMGGNVTSKYFLKN